LLCFCLSTWRKIIVGRLVVMFMFLVLCDQQSLSSVGSLGSNVVVRSAREDGVRARRAAVRLVILHYVDHARSGNHR
jgi:hypothetical protein